MLSVICILCAALTLWLAATLFLWHRELLEIQKALEDIGAGNLNRRIVRMCSGIATARSFVSV